MVQVDEQQRRATALPRVLQPVAQAFFKGRAVEQPCQRVVAGRPRQAFAGFAPFGHVFQQPDGSGGGIGGVHRPPLQPAPEGAAVAAAELQLTQVGPARRKGRTDLRTQRFVFIFRGVDFACFAAHQVVACPAHQRAEFSTRQLKPAVPREGNAYGCGRQHRAHLLHQHMLGLLILCALRQHLLQDLAELADFTTHTGPAFVDGALAVLQGQGPFAQTR